MLHIEGLQLLSARSSPQGELFKSTSPEMGAQFLGAELGGCSPRKMKTWVKLN